MIIKSIRLDPFGNISGESFSFEEGKVNIFVGDTGAGKTTIFDALYSVLFIRSNVSYSNREYKKYILGRYPLVGGNYVQISLKFEYDGEEYKLTRKWSKDKDSNSAILESDQSGSLDGDKDIQKRLNEMLPSNKGTFKNVLMSYQSKLQQVFEIDGNDNEVFSTLDELLRRGLGAGGLSPSDFLNKISDRYDEYFKKWDTDSNRPKIKGGVQQYKVGTSRTGKIHDAYWALKRAKQELSKVEENEGIMEEINKDIADLEAKINDMNTFTKDNQRAYEDAKNRKELERDIEIKDNELKDVESDIGEWKRRKKENIENKIRKEGKNDRLNEISESIRELETYAALEDFTESIAIEKEKLEAGKLTGKISAKQEIELEISKDTSSERETINLENEEETEVTGKGVISIYTESFDLEVKSGEGKFDEVKESIEEMERELENKARDEGIELPLETEGTGKKLEEKRLKKIGIKSEIQGLDRNIENNKKGIGKIKKKYEVSEKEELLVKKIRIQDDLQCLKEQLDGLAPLPAGFTNTEAFIKKYKESRDSVQDKMECKSDLLIKLSEIESPKKSSDELKEEIEDREREYQRSQRKGQAYALIKEKAEELMEDGDVAYAALRKGIEDLMAKLSGKRYDTVTMDDMELKGIKHPDGYDLLLEHLSKGEEDLTSLAVRLAMAKFYLKESDGFIVMDDPLVNLDPQKRENAAETITEIAEDHQVLLMTCDPEKANLFQGANQVEV